jgi:hypothetical protein
LGEIHVLGIATALKTVRSIVFTQISDAACAPLEIVRQKLISRSLPSTSTRARTGHGLAIIARESLFLSTTYRWLCAEKQRSTPFCAREPAMTKFIDGKAWVVTVNEIESELVTFEIAEAAGTIARERQFRRANWPRPLSRVFRARSSSAPREGGPFQRISRRLTRSFSTPNRALNTHRSRPSSRSSWCWWTVSSDFER